MFFFGLFDLLFNLTKNIQKSIVASLVIHVHYIDEFYVGRWGPNTNLPPLPRVETGLGLTMKS